MDRQTSRFTENNAPIYFNRRDIGFIMDDTDIPNPPQMVKRQTNSWMLYFGNYPKACAEITDNRNINELLGKTRTHIRRHVYYGLVKNSVDLALYPTTEEVYEAQEYVCEKIELVGRQLQVFADAGFFRFLSKPGEIIIFMEEPVYINFVVADDTGMFHVLISKATKFKGTTLIHPDTKDLNKLIYLLRNIFEENQSPLCSNFDFVLDEDKWHSLQHLTLEATEEYLPRESTLSLIHPDLLAGEDDLEWCQSGRDISENDF